MLTSVIVGGDADRIAEARLNAIQCWGDGFCGRRAILGSQYRENGLKPGSLTVTRNTPNKLNRKNCGSRDYRYGCEAEIGAGWASGVVAWAGGGKTEQDAGR